MKKDNVISLNGKWAIEYLSPEAYLSEEEAKITDAAITVENAVPGYFEDMLDDFRKTPVYRKLSWNPTYTLHRYPIGSYCPDMTLPNPVGSFAYKRSFTLSEISGDAALYCGGVQNTLSAWINGVYLGRHEGYSAEFTLNIPNGTLRSGENNVTLVVSNNRLAGYKERPVSGLTSRAANECTGGIWGDVEIRFYPDGIRDVFVRISEDTSEITVCAVGGEDKDREVLLLDGNRTVRRATMKRGESRIAFSSEGMKKWSPDSPKLYKAVVKSARQTLERRFGVRRLVTEGTKLYLNGEPYYFRGTCEHCYHPITVHPTRDKGYYRRVLRIHLFINTRRGFEQI